MTSHNFGIPNPLKTNSILWLATLDKNIEIKNLSPLAKIFWPSQIFCKMGLSYETSSFNPLVTSNGCFNTSLNPYFSTSDLTFS